MQNDKASCVPIWINSTIAAQCNRHSVCNVQQHTLHAHCIPFNSLNLDGSCWSSADLCADGLYCQPEIMFWKRSARSLAAMVSSIASTAIIAQGIPEVLITDRQKERASKIFKIDLSSIDWRVAPQIHPIFTSSISTDCWLWQLHDMVILKQVYELQQNSISLMTNNNEESLPWIDAHCIPIALKRSDRDGTMTEY